MPRYFFDTNDGDRQIQDANGVEFTSRDDAHVAARDLLFDLGNVDMVDTGKRVFTAAVRDEKGETVFRASMVLMVEHQA
jgi:hypothetical protein